MSSGNSKTCLFGTIFAYFYLFWNYSRDRQQGRLNSTLALTLQNNVYIKLVEIYQKNKWDIRELNWTCTMINLTSDVVNPYEVMNEQYAYLGQIQICYYIAICYLLAVPQ